MVEVIILAADGKLRFNSLTRATARCLLSIRGTPIIEHIINKVQLIDEVATITIVGSRRFFKQLKGWIDNYSCRLPIELIADDHNTRHHNTGAIKTLSGVIDRQNITNDVLLIGADNMFSFTLNDFIEFSRHIYPAPVVGLYNANGKLKPNKFGVATLGPDARMIDFCEKPGTIDISQFVSTCLYFFPRQTLPAIKAYAESNGAVHLGDYIEWLCKKDHVYGYIFEGDWLDIADIESYTEAVFTF
ncbi:MAG: hypothetical protein JSW40_03650 [Candidatus Omnitrophota bacterium]|nr:MAG: hypothetical protein JSW40_03650 [Candidatus Omnitrophota bacterium]